MTGNSAASLAEKQPGNSENYLETAIFALISDNNIASVNAGRGGATLREFLRGYFQNMGLEEDAAKFDLTRIAAVDKIQKIQNSGGVEKVQLDLALKEATMMHIEETIDGKLRADGLRSQLAAVAQKIFASQGHPAKLANSNNGKMRLTISVPSRDPQPAKEGLDAVAGVLTEDEFSDDYVLMLRNGDTITPSEISAKCRIRVSRYANTLDLNEVMTALRGYMAELYLNGQTDV
ncbi:hypothetical protein SAMN04488043_104174 [Thalassovita gelatinovora]|nr:hypothetical protein SAMN04488043_104174 [Thalassovita gelatinovora]